MNERNAASRDDVTVLRAAPPAAASGAGRTGHEAVGAAPAGRLEPSRLEPGRGEAGRAEAELDTAFKALPGAVAGNGLVRAATPLLLLAVQLRHSAQAPELGALRAACGAKLQRFEGDARQHGVDEKIAMMARYVLCTLLDEAVLAAPWGDSSGWSQRTLLVSFHGETYGGAKVFDLLDRLSREPARYLDLLEMIYLALALGFGGRYLVEPGGQARLADRLTTLHALIRRQRDTPPSELSPHWRGADYRLQAQSGVSPLLVAALASLCMVLATFLFLHTRLNSLSAPISAQLARIGFDRVRLPTAATPAPAPDLAGLLRGERDAGLLSVDSADGKATIRIAGAAMFPSASAEVDAAQRPLLARVAAALDRLPGRIVVVGHTDDQPVRSLAFRDNFELSARRAQNVGALLAANLRDPRRIEHSGAGDSQPIAVPAQLPANRARNRRVEIVLIPET
ncbi:type VI secretion system protein TssL, long form [Lysobacter yananisis]|uniref:Type VI secretion system protein TssL, long form n=1 Tax=Lysobacter yananisis TaxID=1003114 RepID=A0ABY9P538_9GAMM|nr:type VI secretion system protein TssL, long form [Lysobacter yananisis]WMT02121.1 type VI secretion system protein TssL, long form [Lysobacter yananisis]